MTVIMWTSSVRCMPRTNTTRWGCSDEGKLTQEISVKMRTVNIKKYIHIHILYIYIDIYILYCIILCNKDILVLVQCAYIHGVHVCKF